MVGLAASARIEDFVKGTGLSRVNLKDDVLSDQCAVGDGFVCVHVR